MKGEGGEGGLGEDGCGGGGEIRTLPKEWTKELDSEGPGKCAVQASK